MLIYKVILSIQPKSEVRYMLCQIYSVCQDICITICSLSHSCHNRWSTPLRDLENLNHPWGGVEGAPRGYPGPSTPPQGGGSGAGAARPRTPTLGCFEISESLRYRRNPRSHLHMSSKTL